LISLWSSNYTVSSYFKQAQTFMWGRLCFLW